MEKITLTDEQLKAFRESDGLVPVYDSSGNEVGYLDSGEILRAFVEQTKRRLRAPGPRYTSAQVQGRLRALQEEWDRTGGFDRAHMLEVLRRLDAEDGGPNVRG